MRVLPNSVEVHDEMALPSEADSATAYSPARPLLGPMEIPWKRNGDLLTLGSASASQRRLNLDPLSTDAGEVEMMRLATGFD